MMQLMNLLANTDPYFGSGFNVVPLAVILPMICEWPVVGDQCSVEELSVSVAWLDLATDH
jgi:hypothetical protein